MNFPIQYEFQLTTFNLTYDQDKIFSKVAEFDKQFFKSTGWCQKSEKLTGLILYKIVMKKQEFLTGCLILRKYNGLHFIRLFPLGYQVVNGLTSK